MANLMKGLVTCMVNDDGTAGNATLVLHGTRATWTAFVANASAGNTAIFDADTNQNISDTSLATADQAIKRFFIGHHNGTKVVRGPVINVNDIVSLATNEYTAGVAKVVTVNSASDIDCETEYCLKVRYESPEIRKSYGYQDMVKTYSYVTRCCGSACGCPDGAAWDVFMGLAEQVNADLDSGMNNSTAKSILSAEVRNSTTVLTVANYDNDVAWTFTKGSKVITCAGDLDYGSGTDVVVGDFIAGQSAGLGTIAAGNADYFRIDSIVTSSASTITLDRPWPHATFTAAAGGSDIQVLPKATGESYADSTWSLVITGAGVVSPSAATTNYTPSYVTDFYVGLECNLNCNASVQTTTAMVPPLGLGYDVIQQEIWATQNADLMHKSPYSGNTIYDRPVSGTDYHATGATNYDCLTITYKSHGGSNSVHRNDMPDSKFMFYVTDGFTTFAGVDAGADGADTLLGWFGALGDKHSWIQKIGNVTPTAAGTGLTDTMLSFV